MPFVSRSSFNDVSAVSISECIFTKDSVIKCYPAAFMKAPTIAIKRKTMNYHEGRFARTIPARSMYSRYL